ncbi:MAG TPA: response regulator transcription factor [Azoarcus taiwanensis]|uniref:Response regulator n=1 Tax=Azoarcus taiwanensis TaxID=666964 RepID=A0A972FIY7_9RHOO|nr:response regulator transcription factor [Azoarcus taiwanensis]NMG03166.1 response regulator [Azoarcus taiwanensis]HRQ58234.1 response regulator transcription factor [Azoarcus taiwanensis]
MSESVIVAPDKGARLLVVDDDAAFNKVLCRVLGQRGFETVGALDGAEALRLAEDFAPAYVVLDLNIGGQSGLRLIEPLRELCPKARIVMLTGYASIATAVDAVKLGAVQYLAKPADADSIVRALCDGQAAHEVELGEDAPMPVDRLEWEHLQRVLNEHDGNISATARALKMHRRSLQRKLARGPGSA